MFCKKYIGLSVRTKQSLQPAKSTAKSNLPLGKRQESLLSHNGHFKGYFPLPDYIRDSKERRSWKTLHTPKLLAVFAVFPLLLNVVYSSAL